MNDEIEIGEDLQITKTTRRNTANGTWVDGTLNGYRFQSLVFSEHADCESYEIGDSRISKLWVQRLADQSEVFCWDRGPVTPAADTVTAAVVDFLAAGLAEATYGN